jgi:hypothetical protein
MMTENEIDELKSLVEKIAAVLGQKQRVNKMSGTSSPSTRLKTLSVSQ